MSVYEESSAQFDNLIDVLRKAPIEWLILGSLDEFEGRAKRSPTALAFATKRER
jgi:hypothetical protein